MPQSCLPSTFLPVCLQVGDGGVGHLQPELWEARGLVKTSDLLQGLWDTGPMLTLLGLGGERWGVKAK